MNIKLKVDLNWLVDLVKKGDSEDDLIDANLQTMKILADDTQITERIRMIKRLIHNRILTVDVSNQKETKAFYSQMREMCKWVADLAFYGSYADDLEQYKDHQYVGEYDLKAFLNNLKNDELQKKLWPSLVFPQNPEGIIPVDDIIDELYGYYDEVKNITQDNIYDLMYVLRYKGLPYEDCENYINSTVSCLGQKNILKSLINTFETMKRELEKAQTIEPEIREEPTKNKKATKSKKSDDNSINDVNDLESDKNLN